MKTLRASFLSESGSASKPDEKAVVHVKNESNKIKELFMAC
jgi:hypothetical protein